MADHNRKADRMRDTAEAFCKAFVSGLSPSETLDKFFTSNPKIFEHGPSWATERLPFLGVVFQGRRTERNSDASEHATCDDYYDLLTSTLSFHPNDDTIPSKEKFMVDPVVGSVTIKLHAKFASVKTGKSWEEDFVYVLSEFDENLKIGSQELWADPLSAWMAVGD
ncbi:hypothetical protein P7C71_g5738, partial [Lecanoromycetidae sp. Uapishka_2]